MSKACETILLDSNLNPRGSFMLSPPFRWTPAFRRAESNFQKTFRPCSVSAKKFKNIFGFAPNFDFWRPKSAKISKIRPSKFDLNLGSIFRQIYSNLVSFWSSKSVKNRFKIQLRIKRMKKRKTFQNDSFYNGF